jgi:hypothetical protein
MLRIFLVMVRSSSSGWSFDSRKSEVGSRKSEVGSRKSEVGSRKSEVGSRKSDKVLFYERIAIKGL